MTRGNRIKAGLVVAAGWRSVSRGSGPTPPAAGTQILAVEIADEARTGAINLEGLDAKVAQVLGVAAADLQINDLAVHATSKTRPA